MVCGREYEVERGGSSPLTHSSKVLEGVWIDSTHLRDQTHTSEQYTMVLLIEQLSCYGHKYLHQIGHLADYANSTQSCLQREKGDTYMHPESKRCYRKRATFLTM